MAVDEVEEFVALALTLVVHVVGAGLLVWGMLDGERGKGVRGWWPRDDDGPGGPPPSDPEPEPPGPGVRGPLPLAGAAPSRVRLREPVRAGQRRQRPGRRPEHAPGPRRVPEHR